MLRSIQEVSNSIRSLQISPVELTKECLCRIDKLNPSLNAFITVTADFALSEAHKAEKEIMAGCWRGPLHGIPVAVKDLIDIAGIPTTAASEFYKDRIASKDAEVVHRLRQAGAIFIGKQNLHEFAYGGSSMISYFGEVRNPWNPAHIAGGSSGGSASAVAAGLCFASIGTDTAGSVREPAALCGIVGHKATYGAVSVDGVIPLSASLDHIGPLTLTVTDAAIVLSAITGTNVAELQDPPDKHFTARIGMPRAFFYEGVDSEILAATEDALSLLHELGATLHDLDIAVPTDRTLQNAEAYTVHAAHIAQHPELFQAETVRRIRNGENLSPEQVQHSRQELQQIRGSIGTIFEKVDVLVTPTTPIPAPTVDELRQNPDQLRPKEILLLRNTRPVNVWGLPAISVPCGFTKSGLPMGLQIIGPHGDEARVLNIARIYENATTWNQRHPPLL